jgi:two-component system, LytTR family, sensor histidine kinase AlgZ
MKIDAAASGAAGPGAAPGAGKSLYLPDFCTSRATLVLILIIELTALVLTLARQNREVDFWADLTRTSFFLLWVALGGAALLCLAKRQLVRFSIGQGSAVVFAIITAVIALVSGFALYLGGTGTVYNMGLYDLFPHSADVFLLRNIAIGLLITAVVLRYFYVTHEWRRNVEMQAAARVHALQARIRPHFLFNSMNTIAALTRSNPVLAEQAVQDLADLFRANLNEQRNVLRLEEEFEVAHIYQRIEELRLGDRLQVQWNVEALPRDALVPGLTLQPLLENAIYHGIEPRQEGGTVTVTGEISGDLITIVVRNPVGDEGRRTPGNQLALTNIRERLMLMYGERALVKSGRFDQEYIVTLRFPHVANREKLLT